MTAQDALYLALGHHHAGRFKEAGELYREVLRQQPNQPDAVHLIGVIALQMGDVDRAVEWIGRAISLNPRAEEYHNNFGEALRHQGKMDQALAAYRKAIALRPDYADALMNLGNVLRLTGQLDEALAACRELVRLRPDSADAHNKLANVYKDMGRLDEALAGFGRAISLEPANPNWSSNRIYTLHYHAASDARSLVAESREWNRRHAEPLNPSAGSTSSPQTSSGQGYFNDRSPDRKLRIGYVSPDFHNHPVGRFVLPLLAAHDHDAFEIYCYADVCVPDETTAKLRADADVWRSIDGLSDERVAEMIHQDGIDILVDLAMHASRNRLPVFARKPAPVQVSYLAYAGGTGLDAIDYRLTDRYLDPDEADDKYYVEKSVRLSGTYWCYQPPAVAPPVNDLPAQVVGRITLGCLNAYCKVTPDTLETWARLLLRLGDARLLLHAPAGSSSQALKHFLADRGIDPDRLECIGHVPFEEYFQTYGRIDIALDPFPYAGGTTTCDALWMGVPVVTLSGRTAVGRSGVSILSNAGLPELVARTTDEYERIVAGLAGDLPRLSGLRSTLRQRLKHSLLMDAPRFVRGVESAYRQMWREWCRTATA